MTTVHIVSIPFQQSWDLPRESLLKLLPESLLSQALEDDPKATNIVLDNPIVTPEAMQVIIDWLHGLEPTGIVPNLESSADYLNIPWLGLYSDPLYAELEHPIVDTERNREVLNMAINEGNIQMVLYLLSKGIGSFESAMNRAIDTDQLKIFHSLWIDPRNQSKETYFWNAVKADALDIVKYLLPTIELSRENIEDLWIEAVQAHSMKVIAYLLLKHHQDIDLGKTWDDALSNDDLDLVRLLYPYSSFEEVDFALRTAIVDHQNNIAEFILSQPDFHEFLPEFIAMAAEDENLAIVEYLSGRMDPSVDDNSALKNAVITDDVDITKFLLADPRVHPETIEDRDRSLRSYLHEAPTNATTNLLLADGRLPRDFFF